jgi:putative endonuclease
MKWGGCVYIITNERHTVLYTGVTSNLAGRMYEHKTKAFPNSFSSKYNCNKLVYYCGYSSINEAIAVEKQIKAGSRQNKIDLINAINPGWLDLTDTVDVL